MTNNKVAWAEGLFLRSHLFQQQERYLEWFTHQRLICSEPFYWGFKSLHLNKDSLVVGKLSLFDTEGIMPDGTPFNALHSFYQIPSIQITDKHIGMEIFLATPAKQPNGGETTFEADFSEKSMARYVAVDEELFDSNVINRGTQIAQISKMQVQLLFENELNDSWNALPIARVQSVLSTKEVILDANFVPPIMQIGGHEWILHWLDKLVNLLNVRANNLADRLSSGKGNTKGGGDVADYLLLTTLNKYNPVLKSYLGLRITPPIDLYYKLMEFAGEIATFMRPATRRPSQYPSYVHLTPYDNFNAIFVDLYSMLNAVLVRGAELIQLQEDKGMHIGLINPTLFKEFDSFVVMVTADVPIETLIDQFKAQTKFASVDYLPELIKSHLQGLSINMLPVPPRQLPYQADSVYYEIVRKGSLWTEVEKTGSIAMHIAGKIPGLNVELWGVRNQ